MPTAVPIEIFNVARTQVDRDAVRRWLDFLGADQFEIPDGEAVSDPALLVALAGKRCYKAFQPGLNPNVTKVRSDYVAYFDNILASGHGSVLEHAVYTYAIENVSRVFTGEMNRHRAGWAISEGSMRFIRYGESIPYWEPESIRGPDVLIPAVASRVSNVAVVGSHAAPNLDGMFPTPDHKKHATRIVMRRAFADQEHAYRIMERIWADELAPDSKFAGKKEITSMMRRVVGMGVATGGVWTGNVRALRHVMALRCEPAAEEEILHVFARITKMMAEREPLLCGDFRQDENGYWRPKYKKV
jgi:thymidylate synthase (FAD)